MGVSGGDDKDEVVRCHPREANPPRPEAAVTINGEPPAVDDEDARKIRRSNRATIIIFAVVVAIFVGPALYQLVRYLFELI